MDIKVTLNKSKVDYSKIVPLRDQADKALDLLWSGKKEEYRWVKMPINFDKDVIDNLDKVGLLIGGRCSMVVIVGEQKTVNTVRNIISALPETGGFPSCLFVDETLSAKAMERVLERVRQNDVVIVAVSEGHEDEKTIANLKILESFAKEKYTEEKIKSHLYFVVANEETAFRKIATEGGYSAMTNTDLFCGEEGVLSPAVLLVMAIVGYNIDDFVKGAEDMLSDPAWDLDLKDYAICQYLYGNLANVVYDEELYHLAGINGLPKSMEVKEDGFYTLIETKENDLDILLPPSEFYEEESLRQMMNKKKEEDRERFSAVISLDRLDAYSVGQLAYFLLISQAIKDNM
ncbi:MAG: hypothetical protein MJ146_05015 [Clostridia bacterium]|nr:hypothetical protein [Clostridia bacterium]